MTLNPTSIDLTIDNQLSSASDRMNDPTQNMKRRPPAGLALVVVLLASPGCAPFGNSARTLVSNGASQPFPTAQVQSQSPQPTTGAGEVPATTVAQQPSYAAPTEFADAPVEFSHSLGEPDGLASTDPLVSSNPVAMTDPINRHLNSGSTPTPSPSAVDASVDASVAQVNHTTVSVDPNRYVARQFPVTPGYSPPSAVTSVPGALGDPYATVDPYEVFQGPRERMADLELNGYPARTGRIMLGGAVNSDAGLSGQLTIDEKNFDITRWPTSFRDLFSGTAFRGRGQTLRLEAAPGTDFQRYMATFVEPSIFNRPISLSVNGFLYDRRFDDWDEQRLGGRIGLGYRITPDLSIAVAIGGQEVKITDPSVPIDVIEGDIPEFAEVLGDNDLYSGEVTLKHDTRNSPILASRGHYVEFNFEETFGDFDYAKFEVEYRQYWTLAERADGSGKQTLSYSTQVGFSGEDTPLFENYFAGGYATLRGFDFRGASPRLTGSFDPGTGIVDYDMEAGGRFQWLNSVEYMFPITADDAFRGVAFVDFGTVERNINIHSENFRVAPGLGLRVAIPMLGPAPLAFDFAYPVAKAEGDEQRVFSFYMSAIR